ncbi:uncharacterized protein MELLADRAFT_103294 [Melampsora larici-populina 98AG31]|uniref:Uncharacterized protein n=1 Tax=Melampsora larici-populina (strain 98AG31 / pathotype 3-4-7) TaxID=747676 RepID=F4R9Y3_MELLP|nr:uncharacterized protein MELLADRAFT_103294 [Melampsora larici-populina 98AG31]EGG10613.1 hypothetical protein MELLADRAFT_103294 [Melampsora larici-populina 98AG31]
MSSDHADNPIDDSQDNSTVTEGSSTSSSADSFGTVHQDLSNPLSSDVPPGTSTSKIPVSNKMSENTNSRVFGDQIQKYSQIMNNVLSKYKVSENLTDDNYIEWSQSLMEVFRSLEFHHYVKIKDYRNSTLTNEEHEKTCFNLTTFILHRLDSVNNVRTRNHLTDPADACEIVYDPYMCWNFLKTYHNRVSEDKLEAVTKALYSCQITKTDSLTSFVDKFENLIREFYRLKGELSDIQSARMLLGAIPSLSIETKEYIHNTVIPLTREGVGTYLRKYEERHGWTCAAIREVNSVSIRGKTGGGNSNSASSHHSQAPQVKGVKKVFDSSVNTASASPAFLSLNVEFDDEPGGKQVTASPSEFEEDPDISASVSASLSSKEVKAQENQGQDEDEDLFENEVDNGNNNQLPNKDQQVDDDEDKELQKEFDDKDKQNQQEDDNNDTHREGHDDDETSSTNPPDPHSTSPSQHQGGSTNRVQELFRTADPSVPSVRRLMAPNNREKFEKVADIFGLDSCYRAEALRLGSITGDDNRYWTLLCLQQLQRQELPKKAANSLLEGQTEVPALGALLGHLTVVGRLYHFFDPNESRTMTELLKAVDTKTQARFAYLRMALAVFHNTSAEERKAQGGLTNWQMIDHNLSEFRDKSRDYRRAFNAIVLARDQGLFNGKNTWDEIKSNAQFEVPSVTNVVTAIPFLPTNAS